MTREELKNAMPILTAFVEGKTIQNYLRGSGKWIAVGEHLDMSDLFAWPSDYRIKPEPKYRPFKNTEECWNEMLKHQPFGWIKDREGQYRHVMSVKDESDFAMWFANYIFIDGIPFGIKDE